jgi:hypothetical protein
MIVNDSTRFPSGLRHTFHNPAKAKGSLVLSLEMYPHRDLAPSFFAPLIKSVSGNNTAASIYQQLEGRQLHQRFRTGVNHPIADGRVCGPMRNQSPLHKPALVNALVPDNDGNRRGNLLGGNVKAGRVLWQIAVQVPANARMSLNSNVAVNRPHIASEI